MREPDTRARTGVLTALYLLFVVYGSLVPLDFRPMPLETALARFQATPWLLLGPGSRGDLVANFVLYLPIGYLLARAGRETSALRAALRAFAVLVAGCALAVGVEFSQLFFAPRTVSLNDLASEALGLLAGVLLRLRFADWPLRVAGAALAGGRLAFLGILWCYVGGYVFYSLFPFDFVWSADELARKLGGEFVGLIVAPATCSRWAGCAVRMVPEALAAVPIGVLLAAYGRRSLRAGLLVGAALSAGLELLQALLVSGFGQGLSILSRASGVAIGVWIGRNLGYVQALWPYARAAVWVGVVPYAVGMLFLTGWLTNRWLDFATGIGRFSQVSVLPFFYHYYLPESEALVSLVSNLVAYAPIGVAVVLVGIGSGVLRWADRTTWFAGGVLAFAVALVLETGKLFLAGKRPDFTNVIIAFAGAWFGAATAWALWRGVVEPEDGAIETAGRKHGEVPRTHGRSAYARVAPPTATSMLTPTPVATPTEIPTPVPSPVPAPTPPPMPTSTLTATSAGDPNPVHVSSANEPEVMPEAGSAAAGAERQPIRHARVNPVNLVVAFALLALAAVSLWRFPILQLPLALGLAAYAALLYRQPLAYLVIIPLALPVLDLAPLSGRFFWDEFDLVLATTLGIRLAMPLPVRREPMSIPGFALWLLALSVALSAAISLWPLAPLDANAFSSYLSSYNALRIAKGYAWAGGLLWLMWRDAAAGDRFSSRLLLGLGLGLLAAAMGTVWERVSFVGIGNFGAYFRAAGLVSATHVGGAYLEAILVALTPFALALAIASRRWLQRILWYAVVLLGASAVLMTLSRAAFAALLLGLAVFAVAWWRRTKAGSAGIAVFRSRWFTGTAMLAVIAITVLAAQSTFLRERLAVSNTDFSRRLSHWGEAGDLMRGDPLHLTLGMGLGSFPREFYVAHAVADQLPAYRLEQDEGSERHSLTLSGGRGMYLDQRIAARPGSELVFRGEIRSAQEGARLSVGLCEKSFLNSTECDWANVPAGASWQPFELRLKVPQRARSSVAPTAPVAITLHNRDFGKLVEVTALSLLSERDELLRNASFTRGLDQWFVYSDVHLAWRVLSTPLQVVFEQGVFGVLAWLALGIAVAVRAARRAATPEVAAAFFASLAGLFVASCFDTLLDAPRLVVLCALVLGARLLSSAPRHRRES